MIAGDDDRQWQHHVNMLGFIHDTTDRIQEWLKAGDFAEKGICGQLLGTENLGELGFFSGTPGRSFWSIVGAPALVSLASSPDICNNWLHG